MTEDSETEWRPLQYEEPLGAEIEAVEGLLPLLEVSGGGSVSTTSYDGDGRVIMSVTAFESAEAIHGVIFRGPMHKETGDGESDTLAVVRIDDDD